jgi:uncharacterized protein
MTYSISDSVLPAINRSLTNLSGLIAKAQAHCDAKKIDPNAFMQARLYPDMLPFPKQIHIACDISKFAVARLAGIESPKFEDNEVTLEQLIERIKKTLDFVNSVPLDSLTGTENKTVTIPRRDGTMQMLGADYVNKFVIPNVYFHCSIAYALLRQGGVEIGKQDFLGPLN